MHSHFLELILEVVNDKMDCNKIHIQYYLLEIIQSKNEVRLDSHHNAVDYENIIYSLK